MSVETKILYRNYRGEIGVRTITPYMIIYGVSEWHPEPQWSVRAWDKDKGADRQFALKDILGWGEQAVERLLILSAARQHSNRYPDDCQEFVDSILPTKV